MKSRLNSRAKQALTPSYTSLMFHSKPSITSNFNAKKFVLMTFVKIISRRGKDTTRIKFIIRKILI